MVLLGGATVLLYQKIGININAFMAVHLGIATPLLISTATKEKPKVD
jgi:cytosine/uracil/thiamine/allantoin permease